MEYYSIGKNIRKYRVMRKFTQEEFAEKADISTNYVGALERGEKLPSIETFINIVNALEVSADMILCDVLDTGYTIKNSLLDEKISKLSADDRKKIYDVIDVMIKHSKQIMP